jgi:hypothetical protein
MHPCACRDCFEITAGNAGSLCWECEEAGCEAGAEEECQRAEAYGMGEECQTCNGSGRFCDAPCPHC